MMDDLTIFNNFLEEDFCNFYIKLSNVEDLGNYDDFLFNYAFILIDDTLNKDIYLNKKDRLVLLKNILVYFTSVIFNLERNLFLEDNLKWFYIQIKSEYKILKILRKAFLYSKNNIEDNNISRILLLLGILDKVRFERIKLENNNFTRISSWYKNFSVDFFNKYDFKELDFTLDKVLEYSSELKR